MAKQSITRIVGAMMFATSWILMIIVFAALLHRYFFITKPPIISYNQNDPTVILQRDYDYHFRIAGTINNQPINFIIDTGASMLTVSESFAKIANLKRGPDIAVSTAQGDGTAYMTNIDLLELGPWKFRNVNAIVIAGLPDDALLGMNVLKRFKIEQTEENLSLFLVQ